MADPSSGTKWCITVTLGKSEMGNLDGLDG
jgi:hypothetical protein